MSLNWYKLLNWFIMFGSVFVGHKQNGEKAKKRILHFAC
jgi:hypothetical protein